MGKDDVLRLMTQLHRLNSKGTLGVHGVQQHHDIRSLLKQLQALLAILLQQQEVKLTQCKIQWTEKRKL